jgi:glycosyltransferase involved in cell wall biosynthesis
LHTGIPFRVVYAHNAGLAYARQEGIKASKYEYLIFCDDDNHLDSGYVEGIFTHLENNPKVAAVGGRGIPQFEGEQPDWFTTYSEVYAVGSQEINKEGDNILNLYGAGIGIRKSVLHLLEERKFTPVLVGRSGKNLSSAEDTELTYAMVLLGFRLMYDEQLTFIHYLPKERLNRGYLEKIMTSFGADGPVRNLYYAYISKRPIHKNIKNWYFHLALCYIRFVKYLVVPPKKDGRRIYLQWNKAYLKSLFEIKHRYAFLKMNIESLAK